MVRRQIDKDVAILMSSLGRLSEQQLQLCFVLQSVVLTHKPDGLGRLLDSDVALATGTLAAALETASRGLIYEETTGSVVAEGVKRALRTVVDEITRKGGSRAEREVALVLRTIELGARHEGGLLGEGLEDYLQLVARVLQHRPSAAGNAAKPLIITP